MACSGPLAEKSVSRHGKQHVSTWRSIRETNELQVTAWNSGGGAVNCGPRTRTDTWPVIKVRDQVHGLRGCIQKFPDWVDKEI